MKHAGRSSPSRESSREESVSGSSSPRRSNPEESTQDNGLGEFSARLDEYDPADRRAIGEPEVSEEEIRARAYELYKERGEVPGHELEDWLTAEREIRERARGSAR